MMLGIKKMSKKIFFKNKKAQRLCGILEEPNRDKKEIVIIVHGYSSNKNGTSATAMSSELTKRKMNSFRIDLDGCGESEGNFAEQTVTSTMGDALAAIKTMRKHGYKKISFFGASAGGLAAMAAALKYKNISKIGLAAPVSDWISQRRREYGQKYLDDWEKKGHSYYIGAGGKKFKVNYSFVEDAKKYVVYDQVNKIKCPVLIVHGDKDNTVALEDSKRLVKGFPDAKLIVIKGADHMLQINGNSKKAYNLFGEFFSKGKR